MLEDKLLIWKFKLGSSEALRTIYQKYRNDLLKVALALDGDIGSAEDVVQDVFVRFAQSAHRIGPSGSLKAYLITAVANAIRNRRRDRKRHRAIALDGSEQICSQSKRPEQWAILSEQMQLLSRAMAQVPYEQREVIALRIEAEMTFRRIAKIQNASVNTVQGRYRYGLAKLRSLLNSEVQK